MSDTLNKLGYNAKMGEIYELEFGYTGVRRHMPNRRYDRAA